MKIPIVEGEAKTARAMRQGPGGEGCDASIAKTGGARVLLVTARGSVEDRVVGLDSGAEGRSLRHEGGRGVRGSVAGVLLAGTMALVAGPPFTTDDPEPVQYQHWEWYVASQQFKPSDGWSGTAPHFEANYGAISNLQLHVIAPLAYTAPVGGRGHWGYGDTELGAKYRFVQETKKVPQIGVFPLLEVPTGNAEEGLGSGHWQAFLPVWAQKSFGAWTIYGGSGYGINPGAGNRDWGFVGAVLQKQARKNLLVGGEIYHRTSMGVGEPADTAFNLGAVFDLGEQHHLLFSAGRSISGPTDFQAYIAYQLTLGPGFFHGAGR